jgi:epsilon-lactone hydrolase
MSRRAEWLRRVLGLAGQRRIGPRTTVASVRRKVEFLGRLAFRPPHGARFERVQIGGAAAERSAPPLARADRHVLFFHGGGYVLGSAALYRDFSWRVAAASRATVLCLDYRLAPEHPFPAAVDDAVAAYRALLAAGAEARHVAFAGDSAGGGLALAAMLRLRDEGVPLPAAAAAISPWTDLALTGASLDFDPAVDPLTSREAAIRAAELYLAGSDPRLPYASPLYGETSGFPPTLILAASTEILRDDAVRMAENLRGAGREVQLDLAPGLFHGWHLFARVLPEARLSIARVGAFLQEKLE